MNDRSLRNNVIALGGRTNGLPRETGFDITAASEVMALMAVTRDLDDLRERLGKHHDRLLRATASRSPRRTSRPRAR